MKQIKIKSDNRLNKLANELYSIDHEIDDAFSGADCLNFGDDSSFDEALKIFNKALKLNKPIYNIWIKNEYISAYYIGDFDDIKLKLENALDDLEKRLKEREEQEHNKKIINYELELTEAKKKVKKMERLLK